MAERSSSQSRGWPIAFGVLVLAVVVVLLVRSMGHDRIDVHVVSAAHADMTSTVSTNGEVDPVEDYQARALAPGKVERVFVDIGDKVQRGQELVRLDSSDARKNIAAARAQLDSARNLLQNMQNGGSAEETLSANNDLAGARAQLQTAQTRMATMQALVGKGAVSANELASAQQAVTDAQTRVNQLKARRSGRYSAADLAAQQAQVTQAQAALAAAEAAYSAVDFRAPFAGTIYGLPVRDFDYVQGNEALLNMADLNHLQVRAYVDEPEIGQLAIGQPVKVVWDAKPKAVWHGHLVQAPTTIINYHDTRHVGECLISVDDARGDLLPNTNVTVTITVSQKPHVLTVPREALRTEPNRNYVFRVVDGHLKATTVQVGTVNLTRVEITSGLNDGDTIAVSAEQNAAMRDGVPVKVLP